MAGRDVGQLTRAMIDGGVDIIQVRAKESSPGQLVQLALAVIGVAYRHGVPVIINDDIDVAITTGADGIHLGQEDWATVAKDKLTAIRIIGISTHSLEQARQAEHDGAHYIGVGPVFATGTKPNVKPVGLELVKQVADQITIPFFAIGGITAQNLREVKAAGAKRVAVVSAILKPTEVQQATQNIKERLL